jgi:hypothetical protein
MPTTRRSTKQNSNETQSTKKSASPKNREKQKQPVEQPCYILLYKCSNNDNILVPIYIDEELGEIFMKNMNLVKSIEIKTKTIITYARLHYAKKCCKQVYKFMSKMNSKIYPELSSKVFEKLGANFILPLFDENDEDVVFDYELEKKKQIENENIFKFNWNMDELTKTETTWDLIEWDYEKQDYTYYQDRDEEDQEEDKLAILLQETTYESDEEYEDKNKRMQFKRNIYY